MVSVQGRRLFPGRQPGARAWSLVVGVLAAVALASSAVHAQEFVNSTPIIINESGVATPYPSTINVSGVTSNINNLAITLGSFSHTYPDDVRVLLVGPNGQRVMLMANCGGDDAILGTFLRFSNEATQLLGDSSQITDGAYLPSVYGTTTMPSPAPAGPYGTSLSVFNGANANGAWQLYVYDDAAPDTGSIGAWSVTINGPSIPTPQTTAFSYQGVLKDNGVPITGSPRVRFTLYDHPTRTQPANILGQTIRDLTNIEGGLVNTTLDFGSIMQTSQQKWLGIEVAPTSSAPYTTLTPRQPLTAAPAATNASSPWVRANPFVNTIWSPSAVGIGTAEPRSPLQVRTAGNGGAILTLESGVSSGDCYMSFFPNGFNSGRRAYFGFPDPGSSAMRLYNEYSNGDIELVMNGTGSLSVGSFFGGATSGFRMEVGGSIRCVGVTQTSSARYKDNIENLGDGLDALLRLRPVSYTWNNLVDEMNRGRHDIGFIAEEVSNVLPDAVSCDDEGKASGVDYSRITVLAVQAIKELQVRHDQEVKALEARQAELLARLEALEASENKPLNQD